MDTEDSKRNRQEIVISEVEKNGERVNCKRKEVHGLSFQSRCLYI